MFVFVFLGENETEQLACMMEVLAMPPSTVLEQATRRRLFFGKPPSDENLVAFFLTNRFDDDVRLNKRCLNVADSKGQPRCITNSKGKKRRPGSKDLFQAIKTNDANFLDFIKRCLE